MEVGVARVAGAVVAGVADVGVAEGAEVRIVVVVEAGVAGEQSMGAAREVFE